MYEIDELLKMAKENSAEINGCYVPSRPMPWDYGCWFSPSRLKDAWAVFCGKADAVTWTGQ